MKHVLITGAAAFIGTGLRENFPGRQALRLSDVRTLADLRGGEEFGEPIGALRLQVRPRGDGGANRQRVPGAD